MPRSLVSSWKRVALSGPTADGREITPKDLRDCAATYKTSTYTAVIWVEHERWKGAHGTVYATRLVNLEKGQVALEAQLKPNSQLLRLNNEGQKLFTSVEITPNFANSGCAYMTGLAVTDEPASLGTQELYFSKRTSKSAYYSASIPLKSPFRSNSLQLSLRCVKEKVSQKLNIMTNRRISLSKQRTSRKVL